MKTVSNAMADLRGAFRTWFLLLLGLGLLTLGGACTVGSGGASASGPDVGYTEEDDGGRPRRPAPKPDKPDEPCHYNGHQLHIGKKGGCYYFYDGRKKEYVDRSFCDSCRDQKGK